MLHGKVRGSDQAHPSAWQAPSLSAKDERHTWKEQCMCCPTTSKLNRRIPAVSLQHISYCQGCNGKPPSFVMFAPSKSSLTKITRAAAGIDNSDMVSYLPASGHAPFTCGVPDGNE